VGPYRKREQRRGEARSLAFFHARFGAYLLGALVLIALAAGCTETPRTVSIACAPAEESSVVCHSVVGSIWGVEPSGASVAAVPAGHTLSDFAMNVEYAGGRGESRSRLVWGFGAGAKRPLTEMLPTRFGDRRLRDLFELEAKVRRGERATLTYRSGWGGRTAALPLALSALLLLWAASGRTRVVLHTRDARVETTSRNVWPLRGERHSFALSRVDSVVVVRSAAKQGGAVYRPGFLLTDGEVVALGATGQRSPQRAEHWVAELRKLLELDDPERSAADPVTT
jgi:hypothetical protein